MAQDEPKFMFENIKDDSTWINTIFPRLGREGGADCGQARVEGWPLPLNLVTLTREPQS